MGEITLLAPANTHSHYCRQSWAFSRERCSFGSLLSYTSEGQRSDQVINTESDPFSSLRPLPPAHLQNKGQLDPGPGCPSTTAPHAQGIAFPVLLPCLIHPQMGSSKERVYLGTNPGGQLGFSSLLTNTSDQKQQSSIPGNRSCGCEWTWGWGLGGGTRGRGGAGQWRGQGR